MTQQRAEPTSGLTPRERAGLLLETLSPGSLILTAPEAQFIRDHLPYVPEPMARADGYRRGVKICHRMLGGEE